MKSFMQKFRTFAAENPNVFMFFALFIGCSIAFPTFLSVESISNLLRASSTPGLIAVGMTMVILCGDIDLSVGAVLALGGIVFAKLWETSVVLAVFASLGVGFLCGLFTGLLTVKAKIVAFIATLSTQYAYRGIVYIITNQKAITVKNPTVAFSWFGTGHVGPIPVQAVFFILAAIVASYILKYTAFGRSIYATGGNTEAARMMGIKTDKARILAFCISGMLSALAGVVTTSRLNAAQAVAGADIEMTVIAAIVLGSVLLTGGVGKIYGTFFGVLFIRLLSTTFNNIPAISSYWQNVITGVILLIVVFLQNYAALFRKGGFEKLKKRMFGERVARAR